MIKGVPPRREHFEAFVRRYDGGGWRRLEVTPFSGYHAFDSEQAAIDAARRNDGDEVGYRIHQVVTHTELVENVIGSQEFPAQHES